MNPLAIALQGIGFGVLLVAVQGFAGMSVIVEPSFPDITSSTGTEMVARNNILILHLAAAFVATGALD